MISIDIYGPVSKISGDFPKNAVKQATSYKVQGSEFSPSFKKGLWDGRKHLFNSRSSTFPTGLLDDVTHVFDVAALPYQVTDHRIWTQPRGLSFDLQGAKMEGKYAFQLDACKTAVEKRCGIIKSPTGSGKTTLMAGIINYLELNTLVVVTSKELMYQGREVFKSRLGLTDTQVGIIGDGIWEPGTLVTVAICDTLESRIDKSECQELLKSTQVLFCDEAHHAGSDGIFTICMLCAANYRYALSGTPLDRTDGANLRLLGAFGPLIVDIPSKLLSDLGVLAKAHIIFTKVTEPLIPKKTSYQQAYKHGVVENVAQHKLILDWAKIFYEENLSTLILVEEIKHGNLLDKALWSDVFIPHIFIHGEEDSSVRVNAIKDFGERRLPVLIASKILDEGVDMPAVDALILAGSRKSRIKTMQRLGRGLRGQKLIAVEFANYTNDYLLKHSLQRYEDYKKEECFTLIQSRPDAKLVKEIWHDKCTEPKSR